jgi:hypothetical protein
LLHSYELALKGFCRHAIDVGKQPTARAPNHDLNGWYDIAVSYGLPNNTKAGF